jgi:hypothetical protein
MFLGGSVKQYISDLILEKSDPTVLSIVNNDINKYYDEEDIDKISDIKHVKKVYKEINYSVSRCCDVFANWYAL